jgi:hypothetical protein
MSSAGILLLLSPDSVPERIERADWAELLGHTGPPPVAKLLVRRCRYPRLLERNAFFRWSDTGVLRGLQRWAVSLHGDQSRQPASALYEGSTEELWVRLVDAPGTMRVEDIRQARRFAHDAADCFRDVIVVRCSGRSLPMIVGELGLSLGLKLKGSVDEACEQIASALSGARVLLVLEGMNDDAPFVSDGYASVLYAPAGDPEPGPTPAELTEVFVHWPGRIAECGVYVPYVEAALEHAAWPAAAQTGPAAFAFLRAHERLFEAAHIARVLLARAEQVGDDETAGWAREELSWITGGERVRAARAPVEQLSLLFV